MQRKLSALSLKGRFSRPNIVQIAVKDEFSTYKEKKKEKLIGSGHFEGSGLEGKLKKAPSFHSRSSLVDSPDVMIIAEENRPDGVKRIFKKAGSIHNISILSESEPAPPSPPHQVSILEETPRGRNRRVFGIKKKETKTELTDSPSAERHFWIQNIKITEQNFIQINRFTTDILDKKLQRQYVHRTSRKAYPSLRTFAAVNALIFLVYFFIDIIFPPNPPYWNTLVTRFAGSALLVAFLIFLTLKKDLVIKNLSLYSYIFSFLLGIAYLVLGLFTEFRIFYYYSIIWPVVFLSFFSHINPLSNTCIISLLYLSVVFIAGFLGDLTIPNHCCPPHPVVVLALIVGLLCVSCYLSEIQVKVDFLLNRMASREKHDIEHEESKAEELLRNILPRLVVERLKRGLQIADYFEESCIMFIDVVGFDEMNKTSTPEEVVRFLNTLASRFDDILDRYTGLEKIKSLGSIYMIAGGVPNKYKDHLVSAIDMAFELLSHVKMMNREKKTNVQIRIGLSSGPCMAGVLGKKKFVYDVWGNTVNVASRMQTNGITGKIQCSEDIYQKLQDRNLYTFLSRGLHKIRGKGKMNLYLILGKIPSRSPSKQQIMQKQKPYLKHRGRQNSLSLKRAASFIDFRPFAQSKQEEEKVPSGTDDPNIPPKKKFLSPDSIGSLSSIPENILPPTSKSLSEKNNKVAPTPPPSAEKVPIIKKKQRSALNVLDIVDIEDEDTEQLGTLEEFRLAQQKSFAQNDHTFVRANPFSNNNNNNHTIPIPIDDLPQQLLHQNSNKLQRKNSGLGLQHPGLGPRQGSLQRSLSARILRSNSFKNLPSNLQIKEGGTPDNYDLTRNTTLHSEDSFTLDLQNSQELSDMLQNSQGSWSERIRSNQNFQRNKKVEQSFFSLLTGVHSRILPYSRKTLNFFDPIEEKKFRVDNHRNNTGFVNLYCAFVIIGFLLLKGTGLVPINNNANLTLHYIGVISLYFFLFLFILLNLFGKHFRSFHWVFNHYILVCNIILFLNNISYILISAFYHPNLFWSIMPIMILRNFTIKIPFYYLCAHDTFIFLLFKVITNITQSEPPFRMNPDENKVISSLIFVLICVLFVSSFVGDVHHRNEYWLKRSLDIKKKQVRIEQEKTRRLLLNMIPEGILQRLRQDQDNDTIADLFKNVTILQMDIVDFTLWSSEQPIGEVVRIINGMYTLFDDLVDKFGIEKIKTIGDAYIAGAGVPVPRKDHMIVMAEFALAMQKTLYKFNVDNGTNISIRIGMDSGECVAGVIGGQKKLNYDCWGETIEKAAILESSSIPGYIHVSSKLYNVIKHQFRLNKRVLKPSELENKNIHPFLLEEETFFLVGQNTNE